MHHSSSGPGFFHNIPGKNTILLKWVSNFLFRIYFENKFTHRFDNTLYQPNMKTIKFVKISRRLYRNVIYTQIYQKCTQPPGKWRKEIRARILSHSISIRVQLTVSSITTLLSIIIWAYSSTVSTPRLHLIINIVLIKILSHSSL